MNLVLCPFQRAGIGRRAFDVKRSSIVTSLLISFLAKTEWLSRLIDVFGVGQRRAGVCNLNQVGSLAKSLRS